MFKKISTTDFFELKDKMKQMAHDEIDLELKTLWDEFECTDSMEPKLKEDVLKRINQHILFNDGGNKLRYNMVRKFTWRQVAAMIAFPLLFAFGSYYFYAYKSASRQESFIVLTEPGQKLQLFLPDSTHVWLNSNSRLTYSSDFNKKDRKVKLEGEGFFSVHKHTKKKFVVETERVNVTVHGTTFNVSSYAEDSIIQISLLQGKVLLEDKLNEKNSLSMKPDQLVSINRRTNSWEITSCNAEVEGLWIRNQVKFENASIDEIYHKLERWYGLNIHVEKNDTNIRYGFTLKNESIREMLDLINKITPITYTIDGKEVQVIYK